MIEIIRIRLFKPKSSDSEISLGFQSINPFRQECLKMGTYFLEEEIDRYGNAPKYAIPSIIDSLIVLDF